MSATAVQVQELDLDLELDVNEIGICHACLSFVSFPLDLGDEPEVRRALRHFAPMLWAEGLALPVQAALHKARRSGVAGAADAIADVEARGPRATIVRAIIRRLAADLNERSRADLERPGLLRPEAHVVTLPAREPA